jgi:hypothetical protein
VIAVPAKNNVEVMACHRKDQTLDRTPAILLVTMPDRLERGGVVALVCGAETVRRS